MVEWFRRSDVKIKTVDKKEIAEGLWVKCPRCNQVTYQRELEKNQHVCNACSHHFRMSSKNYFKLLIGDVDYKEIAGDVKPIDPLKFHGTKNYSQQLDNAKENTGLTEAVQVIFEKINGINTIICVMDFSFIGGSMGSVVGERISQAIDLAREKKVPLVIITSSGGARMQEGAFSLMQLAKTSSKLARFSNSGGLYIAVLTDPTTGGTTASFAMLGDIILAEPNALIGFAGSRVIKQTIGEDLPEGFQRAEFLLEKGFIDQIVHRNDLKDTLTNIFKFFGYRGNQDET